VGLFRSEFLFLARRSLPSEEEQVAIYRKLLDAMHGKPVTIRTFDLRPDKVEGVLNPQHGGWQALDLRDVLQSPSLQNIFREQVRAILRASKNGQAKLLVPLVTTTELLDFLLDSIEEARNQLTLEGLDHDRNTKVGIMVEAAASIHMIPDWCDKIDFFSLGTNDLTASSMCDDRDAQVSSLASHRYNPGVIRMIHSTIVSACQQGKPVTACGELASDPMGYWLLIALGVSSLSVPVRKIGDVVQFSQRYSKLAIQDCKENILKARSAFDLTRQFQEFGLQNPSKSKFI
jgi:hypothetical protein